MFDATIGGFRTDATEHPGCRRIVRTMPSEHTCGGERYVCSDGSVWVQHTGSFLVDGTVARPTGWLHNGYICNHP